MSLKNTIKFVISHPLNRKNKFRALYRLFAWQIQSRLATGPVHVRWVNGSSFLAGSGDTGLTGNIYTGLHEFADMGFLLHFMRPSDLFVDVGANLGSYTILACKVIGARGLAFESVPETHARLVANIQLNGLEDRVHAYNVGLGDEKSGVMFTSHQDTMNHALAVGEESSTALEVRIERLDSILEIKEPTFLKIDVEGFEAKVLAGARRALSHPELQAVILELNQSGERYGIDDDSILRTMLDAGYSSCAYNPFTRELLDLGGETSDSGNTLFVRDTESARERVRQGAKVCVNGVTF